MHTERSIKLSRLNRATPIEFEIALKKGEMDNLSKSLDILSARKVRLIGQLRPIGSDDWELSADLGATVVQTCVVTLNPVTTRLDFHVFRHFLSGAAQETSSEVEMNPDVSLEPLPDELDFLALISEELALALPPYPRLEGAELDEFVVTEPGADALTADKIRPFSGLKSLRDRLTGDGQK